MRPIRPRLAAQLLREGIPVEVPLGGSSMLPLLRRGDSLVVEPATVREVRPGHVVLIDCGRTIMTHRLLHIGPTTLLTRGDDVDRVDRPYPHTALLGRVTAFRRNSVLQPLDRGAFPVACALRALLR